jgi:uncharacterized membrane protein YphA (DoxX/SURF4 family)
MIYLCVDRMFLVMTSGEIAGSVLVAIGGALLFVALYLVLYNALYQYFNPTAAWRGPCSSVLLVLGYLPMVFL